MTLPRLIPVLLLQSGGLCKTINFSNARYVGDPINAVRIFNTKGVDELVLLDIEASVHKREPDYEFIREIVSEAFIPLSYGGGVTSVSGCERLFRIGIEKVVLNSAVTESMELVSAAADRFGRQSIIVGLDVRKTASGRYERMSHSASRATGLDVVTAAKRAEEAGAGELFLNNADRDGTMEGYDLELVRSVAASVSIPVVACGGAGKIEDMCGVIRSGGAHAAAAGSLFVFHGKHRAVLISYPSELRLARLMEESAANSSCD
jgi:cyclase